jgi:HlyD family secretion protein
MRIALLAALAATTMLTAAPALRAETAVVETAAAAPSGIVLPAITVTSVVKRTVNSHVLASGLIGPVEQVSVPPLIEGQPIEALRADVGDTVMAGQILATLSSATLILQKSQLLANAASSVAKTSAVEASKSATRSATLFAEGRVSLASNDASKAAATSAASGVTVAMQALASARAQNEVMTAQMANIDLQLSRTNVVAPVSGVVSARNAELGAIASGAGQPMFVIIRDGALELAADVAEIDVAKLAKDQPVTLSLASAASGVTGTIRLVEPTIDAVSRLGRARISIDANSEVRSGMFASADILAASREALAVPVTAVGSSGGNSTVMAVKDGVVAQVVVTTGIQDGGWIEILTGLSEGDQIVAKAGAFVSTGDKINPIPAETN